MDSRGGNLDHQGPNREVHLSVSQLIPSRSSKHTSDPWEESMPPACVSLTCTRARQESQPLPRLSFFSHSCCRGQPNLTVSLRTQRSSNGNPTHCPVSSQVLSPEQPPRGLLSVAQQNHERGCYIPQASYVPSQYSPNRVQKQTPLSRTCWAPQTTTKPYTL